MDYKVFYAEVADWIQEANKEAMKNGMDHELFWQWVADSCGALCRKYQDNKLVIKQMMMLTEWLEEVYESTKKDGGDVV